MWWKIVFDRYRILKEILKAAFLTSFSDRTVIFLVGKRQKLTTPIYQKCGNVLKMFWIDKYLQFLISFS